jgi:hypothetical protein
MVNFLEIILPYGPGGGLGVPHPTIKTSLFGPATRTFRPEPMEDAIDSAEPWGGGRIQIADWVGGKPNLSAAIAAQAKGALARSTGLRCLPFVAFPRSICPGLSSG